jgi:hypothetical protein
MAKENEKVVSFRLDGDSLSALEEAAERAGVGVHEWAKKAVIRELESGNLLPKIAMTGEALSAEMVELRKDLSVITQALLVSAGKATSEQAAKFVKTNLKGN